jgi:molecular chaperone GrpE
LVPDETPQTPEEIAAANGDSPPAPSAEDAEKLRARVGTLQAQLEESFSRARDTGERLKDTHERLLRTAAEFENFKKRALKDKEDMQKFGNERLLRDFLPVADNLERALDHADQHDLKQVIEGVRLVQKQLESALGKHGVTGFSAVGKPFDPTQHEALMQQESDEPPNTVVSEMARGYKLNDRLIRPAAVVVAKPRSLPPAGDGSGTVDPGAPGT